MKVLGSPWKTKVGKWLKGWLNLVLYIFVFTVLDIEWKSVVEETKTIENKEFWLKLKRNIEKEEGTDVRLKWEIKFQFHLSSLQRNKKVIYTLPKGVSE